MALEIKNEIEKFVEQYNDWDKLLEKDNENKELGEDFARDFYDLILLLKKVCVEKDSTDIDLFVNLFEDMNQATLIKEYVDKSLKYYNAFAKVRLRQEDIDNMKMVLEDIMENFVVNYDPDIVEKYSGEEWNAVENAKLLYAIDSITEYYVKCMLSKKALVSDFQEETGLSKELCEYYAQLYWNNRMELKINFLMNKLDIPQ